MRSLIIMLLLAGCSGPRYADFSPYHDDGRVKPKVVLLPLESIEQQDEMLAEYIQEAMLWDARDRGELFVCSNESDSCAEFVVKVELIENQIVPSPSKRTQVVKLRLRINDVRSDKIILYEVLERSQVLPYHDDLRWDKQNLYSQIANDAALRIEEAILWTK